MANKSAKSEQNVRGSYTMWLVLVTAAICFCMPGIMQAQNLTGTINGVVRDSSGAVIPNATVVITNVGTGLVARNLKTDGGGRYEASALMVGIYSVSVSMPGFEKSVVSQVKLDVDQELPVDVALHVGAATAEVTVSETAVAPDLENAAADTLIDSNQVTELPLGERNFVQLLQLQPGVNAGTGTIPRGPTTITGTNNQVVFSVQGQSDVTNGFFFDGVDFLNHDTNLLLGAYPSVHAIDQVDLLRAGYGAQFGGSGAGLINLVSKAGTSKFHGSAYFFFRNQDLNANTYFNDLAGLAKTSFRYNNFGFSIGGRSCFHIFLRASHERTFSFLGNICALLSQQDHHEYRYSDPGAKDRNVFITRMHAVQHLGHVHSDINDGCQHRPNCHGLFKRRYR